MFNVEGYKAPQSKYQLPDFLLGIDGRWLKLDELTRTNIENFASKEDATRAINFASIEDKGIIWTAIVDTKKWNEEFE